MGRLATAGAETNFGPPTTTTGIIDPVTDFSGAVASTTVTAPVRSGTYAFGTGNGAGIAFSPATIANVVGRTYFLRFYFNVHTAPSTAESIFSTEGNENGGYNIRLATDLTITLRYGTSVVGSASAAFALDTWYRVEISWVYGSGSSDDSAELRIDGATIASEASQTRQATGASTPALGSVTGSSTNSVTYLDDIALNDDQGANQNTWPGDAKVVLLRPISDNAVGAGWTLGTGTAFGGNGFGSVDNTPPTGVADLAVGSDPKQIRNASSNANSNYDANLTTYTNAGIGAGSTINLLDPVVATAAPVVTSAKQGTVGVASNPAITNIALASGGTAGAFWSGIAGGTYPTGWKISHGTLTYAPSVTLGTSPVMRITQVTASTRIAVVCFMAMYVDYTPAVVSQVPYVNPMPPLIAQ